MVTLAPTSERSHNSLAGLAERVRNKVRGWLGHAAMYEEVQTPMQAYGRQTMPPAHMPDMASHDYLQRQYGYANDYRVDPFRYAYTDRAAVSGPPMVMGEQGPRHETRAEKAARVEQFNRTYPDANVLERHNFSYSCHVPDTLASRTAYDQVNPYNPNASHPYTPSDLRVGVYNPSAQQEPMASSHPVSRNIEVEYLQAPMQAHQPGSTHLPHAA
jgi:hypothetical protein